MTSACEGPNELVIDSRHRAPGESADSYTVSLASPLCGANSMRLLSSSVPFAAKTVDRGYDTFAIDAAGATFTCNLPHGNVADAAELAAVVAAAASSSGVRVTLSGGRLTFAHAIPITVRGAQIARLLGLRPTAGETSTYAGGEHVVTAPFEPDLGAEPYLAVFVDACMPNARTASHGDDGAFAIVREGVRDYVQGADARCANGSITRLRVRFVRPGGEPYEFNGRDHHMRILVT